MAPAAVGPFRDAVHEQAQAQPGQHKAGQVEPAGQRLLSDPQVQQSIRDTLRSRKEQLLRAAYIASLRDQAKVTNYLAQQVIESAGKLPEIPKFAAAVTPPLGQPSAPPQ